MNKTETNAVIDGFARAPAIVGALVLETPRDRITRRTRKSRK
jgi:hypothetical protein